MVVGAIKSLYGWFSFCAGYNTLSGCAIVSLFLAFLPMSELAQSKQLLGEEHEHTLPTTNSLDRELDPGEPPVP